MIGISVVLVLFRGAHSHPIPSLFFANIYMFIIGYICIDIHIFCCSVFLFTNEASTSNEAIIMPE